MVANEDPEAPNTFPSGETVEADRADSKRAHEPDREPTPDEERAVNENGGDMDPRVADAYRDAMRRGADQKGEGRID